jgi:hypothetical protein
MLFSMVEVASTTLFVCAWYEKFQEVAKSNPKTLDPLSSYGSQNKLQKAVPRDDNVCHIREVASQSLFLVACIYV